MRSEGYRVAVGGGLEALRIVLRPHPPGLHVRLQRAFLQLDVTQPLNRLHRRGLPLQREKSPQRQKFAEKSRQRSASASVTCIAKLIVFSVSSFSSAVRTSLLSMRPG